MMGRITESQWSNHKLAFFKISQNSDYRGICHNNRVNFKIMLQNVLIVV